jgi:hypothetical protein
MSLYHKAPTLGLLGDAEQARVINSMACRSWYERNRAYVLKMRRDRYATDPDYAAKQKAMAKLRQRKRTQAAG